MGVGISGVYSVEVGSGVHEVELGDEDEDVHDDGDAEYDGDSVAVVERLIKPAEGTAGPRLWSAGV